MSGQDSARDMRSASVWKGRGWWSLLTVMFILAATLVFLLFGSAVYASDGVSPEPLLLTTQHESLTVEAAYSADLNGNCTLIIFWGGQGTDWGDASISSVTLPHQPSPFRYKISGLNNFQMYQVKVVFQDDEGVDNGLQEQILLSQVPHNSMVHSSYTTGSLKWSARGGWGLPGAQYGEFSCKTCHAPRTGNIKRIKKELTATVNGSPDVFPIQAEGGQVTFLNANKGVSQFGDDQRLPADRSTNVCEACHSKNKYHNYNTANNQATDHYNRDTCTGCHQHNQGFKAGCEGCHPAEPVVASHDEHYNSAIMNVAFSCDVCHATSEHRNSSSEVRFTADLALVAGAAYSEAGGDESSCYTEDSGYCATPVYGTCNTLYCHSNASPLSGTNAYSQPTWGAASLNCQSCHNPVGGSQAMSAPHGRHTDPAAYAYDCSMCHAETATGSTTISDASLHINRLKDVSLAVTGNYNAATFNCTNTYCHTDGRASTASSPSCTADEAAGCHYVGGASTGDKVSSQSTVPNWSDSGYGCAACHKGRPQLEAKNAQMDSNGHFRLVNEHWIRQYSCSYCHYKTVDGNENLVFADGTHVNQAVDVSFDPKWRIVGYPPPNYNAATMVCDNIYCHSDGTAVSPEVRDFPWDKTEHANCDSCHGHTDGDDCTACHNGDVPQWSAIDQWKQAMPMYENTGPGTERANSHLRHLETEFSCENCHVYTVVGACHECHDTTNLTGKMTEFGHVDADYHVNGDKDVVFGKRVWDAGSGKYIVTLAPGSYNPVTKTCSNTECHTGDDPQWGDSRRENVICLTCHGTTGPDINDYDAFNNIRGQINLQEWATSGHGRPSSAGAYPKSDNPATDFPGNPCWYCHDNEVVHRDESNPLRLKYHAQFEARFEKECVFCHMEGRDSECRVCHDAAESLSPQLTAITSVAGFAVDHAGMTDPDPTDAVPPVDGRSCMASACHMQGAESQCLTCHDKPDDPTCVAPQMTTITVKVGSPEPPYSIDHATFISQPDSCLSATCHTADAHVHNTNAGFWSAEDKEIVKKQYVLMGVCLQCHDDDGGGQCSQCHTGEQYKIGYDPGTGFRTATSKVTGFHFGWKHKEALDTHNEWRGGMFCWDCHDPHGDTNIFMIQDRVTTINDGEYGIPVETAAVQFKATTSGLDYAKINAPYNGICNVCHKDSSQHYSATSGDNHQTSRRCTECHAHSFSDSHASGQTCDSCHEERPIPRHTAFSQPRDCTKCHEGAVNQRMNIMRQFRAQSHHVQGVEIDNTHCYQCHWEATEIGLINPDYHEGYNYRTHQTIPNAKNDMVVWQPGERPKDYILDVTAVTFTAQKIGTADERAEVTKLSTHCVGCHNDANKDTDVFGDCKTPSQYAWDRTSIAARYLQTGVTNWGKYSNKSSQKAYSAHGNAVANRGGWSATTGEDSTIPNTRNGTKNVQCYDCHSSHGSYTAGETSSYITFTGGYTGANLKETKPGRGGYKSIYMAADTSKVAGILNPMSPSAAQCFDCHENRDADRGTPGDPSDDLPWGYFSTFGATEPIVGYRDTSRFGGGSKGNQQRFPFKTSRMGKGGHLKSSKAMTTSVTGEIRGSCTPCHDPHGVSPTLGGNQQYAVPLLKGTWITSPYNEDSPQQTWVDGTATTQTWRSGTPPAKKIYITPAVTHDDSEFAGLCLRCHPKDSLVSASPAWLSMQRNHRSVKGWGTNAKHAFSCSKCHNAHDSGLGRLMRTNCLNYSHRGNVASGGSAGQSFYATSYEFPDTKSGDNCHASTNSSSWPNNQKWNNVTPW